MFAQDSTSSPFRTSTQSNAYGTPQQSSPFAQPASSSSYFNSSTHSQSTFAGPQFGGGNTPWSANASTGYGSQFGQGGASGQQGSPFAQSQAAAGGAGTPGGKRNYLPGYLSGGAAAQAESTPPQAMTDDSPAHRRASMSGSPVTRFGGGSLFGASVNTPSKSPKFAAYTAPARATAYRAEPEEDAPPIASLHEFDSHEPTNLHVEGGNPLRRSPSGDPSSFSPFASTSSSLHPAPSTSEGYAVHVFGFPPSALDLVLDFFSQFGDVVSKTPSQEGGNWVTICYAQPWSAARAARKNGEVLGGVLMVGVKAVDEDGLKRALAGAEGGSDFLNHHPSGNHTPIPRTPSTSVSTPSGVGKPVNVLGPGSAFKAAPTPTRSGFLGLGGAAARPASTAVGVSDPHASLFADKSKQAVMQQQGQQQKGYLGKVSDLVFGW
ncbi:hypothetical protein JCM11641_004489 [Rhodosporidiobolus odoratus]